MSLPKRITSFLILLCLIGVLAFQVSAAPETGSIQLRLVCDGEPVSGGTLTLYRVGQIDEDASAYTLCPEFRGSGADLTELNDPNTAQALAQYAGERDIQGDTRPVDAAGMVRYAPLETGLYLIVQGESSPGYEPIRPFLVSIPLVVGESVYYDVDASPKVAMDSYPPEETTPAKPSDPRLPQTGQLNWPVPVMAVAGLLLFGGGGLLRFGKRKNNEK